ncbi:MAG: hypothetical protein MI807_00820 [Verrucomicrobiales bacterium]|nr:hypothetical protein [Verrucomicrobiales bacterium]
MNETFTPDPQTIENPPAPPAPVAAEDRVDPGLEEVVNSGVPSAYRMGRSLVLENDPILPTDMCIKSGKRAFRSTEIALRNPRNPMTWFGKQPTVVAPLGRKEFDDRRVAVALTWAILGVGALLTVAGIASLSFLTIGVGILAMAASGIFRAASPVTAAEASEGRVVIRGASKSFLSRFEEVE